MKYLISNDSEYADFLAQVKSGDLTIKSREGAVIMLSDGDEVEIAANIVEETNLAVNDNLILSGDGDEIEVAYRVVEKSYTVIENIGDYHKALDHINSHEILAFDIESTGLKVRSDQIIGFSFSGKIGIGYYLPMYIYDKELGRIKEHPMIKYNLEILEKLRSKKLVMWGGSFDIRILKHDLGLNFTDSLYCEVMLLKHAVDEIRPFKLKLVAVKYQEELGLDVETAANEEQIKLKENVAKNGGETTAKNYEMYKADLGVMGIYACADADLTLRLFELFSQKLDAENLVDFFYKTEVMPLYKYVTIGMDDFGVKLDIELMEKTYSEIKIDIDDYKKRVISSILDSHEGERWFLDSVALKYPPKKTGKFAQHVVEFYELDLPKTKSGKYSLGKKVLENMEGDIAEFLRTGDGELLDPDHIIHIQVELWDLNNEDRINISSKPQLSNIAFNYIGIKPLSKTDGGKPQFNENIIQSLAADYKWAGLLGNYNKLVKIKGSYIERFLENHIDGKFYFYYKQHGTISGRYSSDAQQLPRPKDEGELDPTVLKYNNLIRSFFIANEDMTFIDADYESLEPHVFSHVSNDDGLRDIFKKGHDFYSTIAIKTEQMEGVSADKKADNYLGKVDKPKRQKAKAYCLGIPYGMEGYALGKSLEVPQKEAEKLIKGYLDGFPELKKWMTSSNLKAQMEGFVQSEIGRIRHLPEVKELYAKYGNKLKNWKFRKSLEKTIDREDIKKMAGLYKNGLNNAKNFQIQSLGASIVNLAMIKINKYFTENEINGRVICTVHDQIICEVPEKIAKEIAPEIEKIMASCYELSIKLKAPAEIGYNWRDTH